MLFVGAAVCEVGLSSSMPRLSMPGSGMSTVKENKPAWCSPGRPHSTLLRTGRGRPLGELRSGNRSLSLDGPGRGMIPPAKKAPPLQKDSPSVLKGERKAVRAAPPSQVPAVRLPSPISTTRPKTSKAPVTEQTPPRSRPIIRKPISALVTPTSKFRKPLAAATGTPKGIVTKAKVSTPKGGSALKTSTPGSSRAREKSTPGSSRAREKSQATEDTPVRKARERPRAGAPAAAQEIPKSGSRDNNNSRVQQQQGFSGWAGAAAAATTTRGRKASPTHGRPPVKHLFLSPQVSKKTLSKKDLRKSVENHGIWVGSGPAQRKQRAPTAEKKREMLDSEMLPPTESTHSPEIPKRGSREASGEGIRGYFGAGPMVAPDGVGFLRDRRKCKPRGTLMVGQDGLSMDSMDSSVGGAVESSSVLMPPPSVASVEWMMNNEVKVKASLNLNDFSSGSFHEPSVSMSISDFPVRDNHGSGGSFENEERAGQEAFCGGGALEQLRPSSPNADSYTKFSRPPEALLRDLDGHTSGSFGKERTSQEDDVSDGSLEQFRLPNLNDDDDDDDDRYSKFTKRSQAFLQHLEMRQSQLIRAASFSYVRQSRPYVGDDSFRRAEQQRQHQRSRGVADGDLEYDGDEDITIDWRQGLPRESMDISADRLLAGKNEGLLRSSLSFTSSWVPQSEEDHSTRRLSGAGAGNGKAWCAPDSPWYGFSPITPEFHRNSQLAEGGSNAIDALLAGSVRRRIMTDQSSSSFEGNKLNVSCASLTQGTQVVNLADSSSGLSVSNSSQETTSSFQFGRTSFASASGVGMEPVPPDNFMCQTSSPIERSPFSEDVLCQTASPIDEVCSAACSIDYSVGCSIDCSVDCSIGGSANPSDDDEVEYASPILGDYLSPVRRTSPSGRSDKISLCDELNMGAKAVRKSSMSRTLEELMRHNFTL